MPVPRTSKEDLKRLLESPDPETRPVIVDARLKYPYEHSGLILPGAIRVEPDQLDTSSIPQDRLVVVYDSDPNELASSRVAAALIRKGYQATALKGGISEWVGANFPVESKPRAGTPETSG